MITANFNYKNNKVESFEISGHAFAGEPGEDIVCAAVSAVTFGLAPGPTPRTAQFDNQI